MSAAAPAGRAPAAESGMFRNLLADWPNDDLLFDPGQRAFIGRHYPRLLPLFDWPELRERLVGHNEQAGAARRSDRRMGVMAVALGFASLVTGAIAPVVDRVGPALNLVPAMGALTALLALASALVGYTHLLHGRPKRQWLANRFWTERLRQLHFQFLASNLADAVAVARGDPGAPARWASARAAALDRFVHRWMEPLDESFNRMLEDLAEEEAWLAEEWRRSAQAIEDSAEARQLFELLRHQRLGIQRRYASYKLQKSFHSPRTRAAMVDGAADMLTLLTIGLVSAGGVLLAAGTPSSSLSLLALLAASGIASAAILALRVLETGLRLNAETERYQWYLAALSSLDRRFEAASCAEKAELLRDMERLSYQELRRFAASFDASRFVM